MSFNLLKIFSKSCSVARIMALDRCIRNAKSENSVYDSRGLLVL